MADLHELIYAFAPPGIEHYLPNCPAPEAEFEVFGARVEMRWPDVVAASVAGFVIGVAFVARYWARAAKEPGLYTHCASFALFACMNVSALALHGFTEKFSLQGRVLSTLDSYFTGAASSTLAMAALAELRPAADDRGKEFRDNLRFMWLMELATGMMGLVLGGIEATGPLLYTYVTGASVVFYIVVQLHDLAGESTPFTSRRMLVLHTGGAIMSMGAAAILINQYLCYWKKQLFTAPFWWFLACDLGYLCVWRLVVLGMAERAAKRASNKKED